MRYALAALLVLAACKKEEAKSKPADPGTASATAPAPAPASASPAPAPAPEAPAATTNEPVTVIKIPAEFAKVGDKEEKHEEQIISLKIEAEPGKLVDFKSERKTEEHREVLAVDSKGIITKAKLTYVAISNTESAMGKTKDKPSLLTGKSYIVWRENDEIKATAADGSALPPAELDEVIDEQKNLGTPDPLETVLSSKTWKTGEPQTLTAEELVTINVKRAAKNAKKETQEQLAGMTLTLRKVDDTFATFDMKLSMAITSPKGNMKFDVDGIFKINKLTGASGEMSGTGPLEGNMGVPVTGTVQMKIWAK